MQYRRFGRTGWQVCEVGFGMWAMGDFSDASRAWMEKSLERAIELGCNFFDTAFAYGWGKSEQMLAELLRAHPDKKLYVATKLPPKNNKWPSRPHYTPDETYPYEQVIEYTEKSLQQLGLDAVDLMQFHVWEDAWAEDEGWQHSVEELKRQGLVEAFGISVNRWEPENGLKTLRTGLIDAVQVVYNIFDQAPEDKLFSLCRELDIAVIARVPFDEGSLTGNLTRETLFEEDDWRSTYFVPKYLSETLGHLDALMPIVPDGMTLPEIALRFILSHPDVSITIPGMRQVRHVEANIATSNGRGLPDDLLEKLRDHRWNRIPEDYFDLDDTTPWADGDRA